MSWLSLSLAHRKTLTSAGWTGARHYLRRSQRGHRGHWAEARDKYNAFWKNHSHGTPTDEQRQYLRLTIFLGHIAIGERDLVRGRAAYREARQILTELERETPDNVQVLRDQVTTLEAELLLAEGKAADAIARMKKDYRWFLPHMTDSELFFANLPRSKDVVGRAWLALGQADSALVEYQRLTGDGRPRRDLYTYNGNYELALAKLYEQKGRRNEARAAYERYISFCKHAKPLPPEVAAAKERLKAL